MQTIPEMQTQVEYVEWNFFIQDSISRKSILKIHWARVRLI